MPMTKVEAAAFLGVSTRAVERLVSARQLHPMYRHGKTGREAVFDDAELEAVKVERETPRAEVVQPSQALTRRAPTTPAVARRRGSGDESTALSLDDLSRMTVITVDDAARLSGVGVFKIEEAISSGDLVAHPLGPRGSRVVLREHVEAYARRLFEPETKKRR